MVVLCCCTIIVHGLRRIGCKNAGTVATGCVPRGTVRVCFAEKAYVVVFRKDMVWYQPCT